MRIDVPFRTPWRWGQRFMSLAESGHCTEVAHRPLIKQLRIRASRLAEIDNE